MPAQITSLRDLMLPADAPVPDETRPVPPVPSFPSGRTIHLIESAAGESLTVRAPDGTVELSVRFTSEGPVLSFRSAALDLTATRDVSIDCDRFTVRGRGNVDIRSDEEVVVRGDGNVHVDGKNVMLNCGERPGSRTR